MAQYKYWAEKYTPLAGIAEVRAAAAQGPRLDLPMLFMPAGFEKLEEHGFGPDRRIERVPVDDLREAVARVQAPGAAGRAGIGQDHDPVAAGLRLCLAAQADPRAPLPLLVPLGGYSGPEPALAYAQGQFGELAPELPAYLRSGRVILLLDALNEMPQRGYKERVGRIQALLDQFPDAPVVVTCRALDYVETLRWKSWRSSRWTWTASASICTGTWARLRARSCSGSCAAARRSPRCGAPGSRLAGRGSSSGRPTRSRMA